MKRVTLAVAAAVAMTLASIGVVSARESTCSDHLEGNPHGYHIIADYVTGIGSEFLGGPGIDWPPSGLNAAGGAALPGGPGPAFHFPLGVAPGASFCNPQAQSGNAVD